MPMRARAGDAGGLERPARGPELGSVRRPAPDPLDPTSGGIDFLKLLSLVNAAPDIRDEKVDEIRRAIASGSYAVDAGRIADRILESLVRDRR